MNEKTNVLVIGAPRSGTTLLAGLLSAGQEASPMLPECTYITQIIQHFYNFLHYSDAQRFAAYAIDETTLTKTYKAMVDSMLDTVKSHFKEIDYNYLILKDPELTSLIDVIPTFFGENSKTVCIIRDPRAVIASMLKVEQQKKKNLWQEWRKAPNWFTADDLLRQLLVEKKLIANFFTYYWRIHESQLYKQGKLHIVRYEKIVARDESEFEKLESYLGFKIGREGFGKIHFDFDRADPTYSTGYGSIIQTSNTDFKKQLSYLQLRRIQRLFAGMNEKYGWWK